MTNKFKYFIANWKMFGDFSSIKIVNSISSYLKKAKIKKNKVIFCVPSTLISHFSKNIKKSNISIGAQNCHYLDNYGPYTGSLNAKMLREVGAKYVIVGHSENRKEGDTDQIINKKIKSSIKNNLIVIFCIGETLKQKRKKTTNKVLNNQIKKGLSGLKSLKKIIVAYEPVWSIGTGIIPSEKELNTSLSFVRRKLISRFKTKNLVKVVYGGSVNPKNISELSRNNEIDGFLIGGASQSKKKFIDIIKNCYM